MFFIAITLILFVPFVMFLILSQIKKFRKSREGLFYSALVFFALSALSIFIGGIYNIVAYDCQVEDYQTAIMENKKIIHLEEKSSELVLSFEKYLLKQYPEMEKQIFESLSPGAANEGLIALLGQYPELRSSEALRNLVNQTRSLFDELYRHKLYLEEIFKKMRYREVSPWVCFLPKIPKNLPNVLNQLTIKEMNEISLNNKIQFHLLFTIFFSIFGITLIGLGKIAAKSSELNLKEVMYWEGIVSFAIAFIFIIIGTLVNLVEYDNQLDRFEEVREIQCKIVHLEDKTFRLTTSFENSLSKKYVQMEKDVFASLSPSEANEKLFALLGKYPELKSTVTLNLLVTQIRGLNNEVYSYKLGFEELVKKIRYVKTSPWYVSMPKIPEEIQEIVY
jgi:hypothetical protein